MTVKEVLQYLEAHGNPGTKKILIKHGAREPFFGVKIGDMKPLVKKIKKDHQLSLALYRTGNTDAMYFAGLIADEHQITKEQLQQWVRDAYWYMLSEYTVAWIAAESPYGYELAIGWIESDDEHIASAGWSTLASLVGITPDPELDLEHLETLLDRVGEDIHSAKNRVRYAMNTFVIAAGTSVAGLTAKAQSVAEKIGKVSVDMGGTACKVPMASKYIQKMIKKGRVGKKRKIARC